MPGKNHIKWAAKLAHVREVSLHGTADLSFWTERLKKEDLSPRQQDGRAQIMILGASAKFMGLQFREISISVQVEITSQKAAHAGYLVSAFNSRRFFAFSERFFFSTPYHHAEVQMDTAPAALRIYSNKQAVFSAQMSADPTRQPSHQAEDAWKGPVFIPITKSGAPGDGKFFFADLNGPAVRYPFLSAHDSLTILSLQPGDALSALVDSHFTPQQWLVRTDATHAKSKTYRRGDLAEF